MNAREKAKLDKLGAFADVVAIVFAVIANILALIGEFSNLFIQFGATHGGVTFVYQWLCYPVYHFVKQSIHGHVFDPIGTFLVFEGMVILTAIVYRWFTYLLLRIGTFLFVR